MMISAKINTIVFDCDGVMFQTGELNRKYYNTLLEKFELPEMSDEQFEFVKMHTADDCIAHIFSDKDVDKELLEKERKKLSYRDFVPYMEMTEGLLSVLDFFKERNCNTAIATNRSNTMDLVMQTFNLEKRFDIVVTASDVENPKPHPEQLLKIKSFFNRESENMVYIGDSILDQQAALGAGIIFIAFGNKKLKADFHVNSMENLKKLFCSY